MTSSLEYIRLEVDTSARSKASAKVSIAPGTIILRDSALSTALCPEEKGRRCDYCHRLPESDERVLSYVARSSRLSPTVRARSSIPVCVSAVLLSVNI